MVVFVAIFWREDYRGGRNAVTHDCRSNTYDRPANAWMTEALPIGNGPMGAMLFGGTGIERVQFNEISLWAGDRMAVEGLDDQDQNLGPIRRLATSSSISALTLPR